MPLILDIRVYENARLGVWRIDEAHEFFSTRLILSATEKSFVSTLQESKKLEWLASRYMLDQIMDHSERIDTGTLSSGKPILHGRDEEISLSHSDQFVAAMIGNNAVGIDIQRIRDKILQLENKFANPTESALIDRTKSILHLHILWGAKEVLYKIYSKKQLNFVSHIFVNLPTQVQESGNFSGEIRMTGEQFHGTLNYHLLDNYVLVYGQRNP